jgi:hypothetical protein
LSRLRASNNISSFQTSLFFSIAPDKYIAPCAPHHECYALLSTRGSSFERWWDLPINPSFSSQVWVFLFPSSFKHSTTLIFIQSSPAYLGVLIWQGSSLSLKYLLRKSGPYLATTCRPRPASISSIHTQTSSKSTSLLVDTYTYLYEVLHVVVRYFDTQNTLGPDGIVVTYN